MESKLRKQKEKKKPINEAITKLKSRIENSLGVASSRIEKSIEKEAKSAIAEKIN